MKLISKLTSAAACVAISLCLTAPIFAQSKAAKSDAKSKSSPSATNEADPWQRRLAELYFENVSLAEVANQLSDQFPEINFVLHPAVKEMPVLLKLRSVTLDDIFTALDIATSGNLGQSIMDPTTGLPIPPPPGGVVQVNKLGDRMVSFTLRQPQPALEDASRPVCRAFSLSRYLAGKADGEVNEAMTDIEDALQIAWKMLQSADQSNAKVQPPQLNLHRATKLLIVVGQPSQVGVVEQVISQLEGAPAPERDSFGGFGGRYGIPGAPPAVSPSQPGQPRSR